MTSGPPAQQPSAPAQSPAAPNQPSQPPASAPPSSTPTPAPAAPPSQPASSQPPSSTPAASQPAAAPAPSQPASQPAPSQSASQPAAQPTASQPASQPTAAQPSSSAPTSQPADHPSSAPAQAPSQPAHAPSSQQPAAAAPAAAAKPDPKADDVTTVTVVVTPQPPPAAPSAPQQQAPQQQAPPSSPAPATQTAPAAPHDPPSTHDQASSALQSHAFSQPIPTPVPQEHRGSPKPGYHYALYTIVPLDHHSMNQLKEVIRQNAKDEDMLSGVVTPELPHTFHHPTLASIYHHHTHLLGVGTHNLAHRRFLLVPHSDWEHNGIMIVDFDVDREKTGIPGVVRIHAHQTMSVIRALDKRGNVYWSELKEEEMITEWKQGVAGYDGSEMQRHGIDRWFHHKY